MYFYIKIDLELIFFNIMPKKRDLIKDTITDLAYRLNFDEIRNAKDFHDAACKAMMKKCGSSKRKTDQEDEHQWKLWWLEGFILPYNSTPAAEKRAKIRSGSETPVADPPAKKHRWK